ncbi:MAG: hypothetical protein ACP5M9_01880 [Candidatus Micrarchaeia archaeon]
MRVQLLQFQGFYEPDGFYHFSVIRAAVNNNFVVPKTLSISGWPQHTLVTEPVGLYWITLFPYYILRFFGVSYYDVMRLVPLLFAIFDVLGAYYLSRFLSKDKVFGLLVMAFVALSFANISKTSALDYRGDGFVSIFLILALIFLIELFKTNSNNKKLVYMFLSAFSLSMSNLVWNGAPFAFIIYFVSSVSIMVYSFVYLKKNILKILPYVFGSIIIWFSLVRLYVYGRLISAANQELTGFSALLLIILFLIGLILEFLIVDYSFSKFFDSKIRRFLLILLFLIIIFVFVEVFYYQIINNIFVNNDFVSTTNFVTSSIQELSKPTTSVLINDFGVTLFTTPMSILIAIYGLFDSFQIYFWILLSLSGLIYFFLNVYDSNGWMNGNFRFILDIKIEMIVLLSYFIITGYLNLFAIRFDSLLSIPLAILSAYSIYIILLNVKNKKYLKYGIIILIILIVLTMFLNDLYLDNNIQFGGLITQKFLNAVSWMKNNLNKNSTVLTLWSDGSVIEGWGNLTSVTDSVGAQNGTKIDAFSKWLFNDNENLSFFYSRYANKPDYLLVRDVWLMETLGLFLETGINESHSTNYSYITFSNFSEFKNLSLEEFVFSKSSYYNLTAYLIIFKNNTEVSFLKFPNGISYFKNTAFYNINNENFSIIENNINETNNQTLLIEYSNIPNNKNNVNVTSVMAMANGLARSNMIKLLYFCNDYDCLIKNNNTSFSLIHSNTDSKIFKINYNNSS